MTLRRHIILWMTMILWGTGLLVGATLETNSVAHLPSAVQDLPNAKAMQEKALAGDANAQSVLGDYCYSVGAFAEAVHWYRLAADQGHAAGALSLADCYRRGRGVSKDLEEAGRWLRVARGQSTRPDPKPAASPLTAPEPVVTRMAPPRSTRPTASAPFVRSPQRGSIFVCSQRSTHLELVTLELQDLPPGRLEPAPSEDGLLGLGQ